MRPVYHLRRSLRHRDIGNSSSSQTCCRTVRPAVDFHPPANGTLSTGGESPFVLSLERISKRFGNVQALADVTVQVRPGTVHALLGENGAGKTTLMRIAFGLLTPDAGAVVVNGKKTSDWSPRRALATGLGMVHQHFSLVPSFTVVENVALGGHGLLDQDRIVRSIEALAKRTGFSVPTHEHVERLSVSMQQRVEIIRVLAHDARTLILDEPTAVLAPSES